MKILSPYKFSKKKKEYSRERFCHLLVLVKKFQMFYDMPKPENQRSCSSPETICSEQADFLRMKHTEMVASLKNLRPL